MNFKKTLLASLLMISASGAFAAESATLSVKGTIAPTACDVTIGGAGQSTLTFDVTDYEGVVKRLEPKTTPFNITCNPSAAPVVFKVSDNIYPGNPSPLWFFLGHHAGVSIGHYKMEVTDIVVDGANSSLVTRTSDDTPWQRIDNLTPKSTDTFSFSSTPELEPVTAKSFSANLRVTPLIGDGLPTGEAVEFDGSATITITQI